MGYLTVSVLVFVSVLGAARAQKQAQEPEGCNGVQLTYSLDSRRRIRPFMSEPDNQPYAFSATATLLNSGTRELKSWALLVSYAHREILVSASSAVLTDGDPFPLTTPQDAPTSFSGSPNPDLKDPISTAGDLTQIQAQITIVGTLFGSPPPAVPLPSSLSLSDPFYTCLPPALVANSTISISTCCMPDLNFKPNTTVPDNLTGSPPPGDLTIAYDVMQSFPSNYLALVTIENHNNLGRLDNWQLSWQWMRGEFIHSMKGAYPNVVSPSDCIFGAQGQQYQNFDFSKVLNCQRSPTIHDLPPFMFNNTDLGQIPSCCRNGTILPPSMDPSQVSSAFQIEVFKMPPDLNRTTLYPPRNWKISGGALNPDYQCGQPVRVSSAQFPDPSGLQSTTTAIASWKLSCNITTPKDSSPKCCVSYSAFYNDSVVPCRTCACGCAAGSSLRTCNASAPALLLPPQALLVPFDNRTDLARLWASQKHLSVPGPMPCGDNCGVSINWHILSDFSDGWSARITLFNWDDVSFADWFTAVEMGKAYDGFEAMYSFNGTAMGNDTIFIQGLPGLNYLMAQTAGANPGDRRLPQQSVISFTKKMTPGIDVVAGDGFPSKVFFNGEECSLPDTIPTNRGFKANAASIFSLVLLMVATILVLLNQ